MKTQNINISILLLSVMMLTSFSSAEGDIGTVKQFDCIDLYNQWFVGSGNFTVDAVINTTDMGDPGSNGIIWMNDEGAVYVE